VQARSGKSDKCLTAAAARPALGGQVSGWDVAEQCRSAWPDRRIIYTSGNTADRSRTVAGSQFSDKPYRFADVVAACRNAS
jgi:hypothetical protein